MNEMLNSPDNRVAVHLYKILIDVNEKILKGLSYEKILDFIFGSLDRVIPYDRIGIALLEKNGTEQRIKLNWVKSKNKIEHLGIPYYASSISPSLQNIINSNQPRIINDLSDYFRNNPDSLATELIIKDGIRSNLTCPVHYDNKTIGFIFFSSAQKNTYDLKHIEIFQQIANEISVIINHGKLQKSFNHSEIQSRNINMTLHDLKSPLNVLQGFAEISIDRPWFKELSPEAKLVFETFFRNTQYMKNLVSELSELISLKNGTDACEVHQNKLVDFLKDIEQLGHEMADQKEITFRADFQSTLPSTVSFDDHKIKRVLTNLFSNAIKFSKRKSEILFSVKIQNNQLHFAVQDHGQGILENERSKLFQEFGKTSTRPTKGESSTGQGLAIAKNIIDQHQGEISVATQIGIGSTFSFWIPLKAAG